MSKAADVLRQDTSGYGIHLTMLQARALADLVDSAGRVRDHIVNDPDYRGPYRDTDAFDDACLAVAAAFEAEP